MKKTTLLSIIFLVILCLSTYLNYYVKNSEMYTTTPNPIYSILILLLLRIFSAMMLGYILAQKKITIKPTIIISLITISLGLLYFYQINFVYMYIWHPVFVENRGIILLVTTFLITKIIYNRKKS